MILSDKQLHAAVAAQQVGIEPFEEHLVEPASYDLRVGRSGITTKAREKRNIKDGGFIEIDAGDFALVLTEEIIHLDLQHTGRFGLRSKYARDGLVATVGTQIDPGFKGRLKVGLVNMSTRTILLPYLEHFLTVEFHRLEQPASRGYEGVYQDQLDLVASDYEQMSLQGSHAFSEAFENLRQLTIKMAQMTDSVDKLANRVDGSRGFSSGLIIGILGLVIGAVGITASVLSWLHPVTNQ